MTADRSTHDSRRLLKIVADESIAMLDEYFAGFGTLTRLPGRKIFPADLRDTDVLLVRSVTRVDRQLLEGTAVRFVGTATAGMDHVDLDFLAQAGIAFSSAPGCNANSVVEYVLSALAALQPRAGCVFDKRVSIIGCGNVGGALYRRLTKLNVPCVACDPFLPASVPYRLVGFSEALRGDVVCLHTPLTHTGPHPTWHMLGQLELQCLPHGAILINAGRGAVIDNAALLQVLEDRPDLRCVLDVWESEPLIDPALLGRVDHGTPHIAGYSHDGKVEGTRMLAAALAGWLGRPVPGVVWPVPATPIACPALDDREAFAAVVLAAYDLRSDDTRLRQVVREAADQSSAAQGFDRLRRQYPRRLEWRHFEVHGVSERPQLRRWLEAVGFAVDAKSPFSRMGEG